MRGFSRGLEQDMDLGNERAGIAWSNGPVEGYVNKLKLLKRQMYRQAANELPRRRFLAMGW